MHDTGSPSPPRSLDMDIETIKQRIYSVDFLRGVVMMIMLLDHTRDFVHHEALLSDPTDLGTTSVPLFFTRWITHYCAPTFVFLSGISIYLQRLNGKTDTELSRFLFTRGLWLIFLEFTIVRFSVVFNVDYRFFGMGQVIWVIGVSMIVMAALIRLPLRVVGAIGLLMIVLHNVLDRFNLPPNIAFGGSESVDLTWGQSLWIILHQMGVLPLFSHGPVIFLAYPLIPWVGVMAAGWAFGVVYGWDNERRKRLLLSVGIAATLLFVGLRLSNFYGDPEPFETRAQFVAGAAEARAEAERAGGPPPRQAVEPQLNEPAFTVLSFLNTQKYPPSLLYLLMTLGPALIVLGLTDGIRGGAVWQKIAITFGRVPLFFYILQWFTAHGIAVLLSLAAGKEVAYLFMNFGDNAQAAPADHGFSLPVVHAAWIAGLILLYPLCYWYGNYKRKNKHWLLSYL
ncbi:MAG TPA: heparan-alpha-glucosaminide N-acetyltransferase domain-containing protein [Pyrinomonadaceae bacterium]|nr:heparan-alpha-glucosaminide N-acetyltransferase domain-containing protein [Pyrinomonadaceae bacterium]